MPDKYGQSIRARERETQKALRLPQGKPPEWNAKPVSTFPGKRPKITSGQLDIDGRVVEE